VKVRGAGIPVYPTAKIAAITRLVNAPAIASFYPQARLDHPLA
jgi:hypothetical protein